VIEKCGQGEPRRNMFLSDIEKKGKKEKKLEKKSKSTRI
jgi:hypothetical protein